jgi:putative nucleotidyltransferase with HDIG domain
MQRSFTLPILCTAPIAAGLFAFAIAAGVGPSFEIRDRLGLAAFVFVALLAEMMAVDFRLGGDKQQPHASMAFLPFLGMIAVFSPPIAIAAIAGVVGFSQIFVRRNELSRAVYNMAQAGITAGMSGLAFHYLQGEWSIHGVAAFVIAAVVFFGTNIAIAGAAISFLKSSSVSAVVSQIASGLRYDFLASPIAAFPVALYDRHEAVILVIVLPLLLFHYFHLSKQQLLDAHMDVIRVLIKAIETRDPYTSGHSVRVSTMAQMIATDMGLPRGTVRLVYTAALLHDIGKIDPAFSDVLRKPYNLTPSERALIETHAAKGAAMLSGLRSVDKRVIDAVLHHHERYDGKGYPHGLEGASIPIAARIIMLCDSVDAMLSDRPYRRALEIDRVYEELARCAGTQFDPDIVRVVLSTGALGRATDILSADGIMDTPEIDLKSSAAAATRN